MKYLSSDYTTTLCITDIKRKLIGQVYQHGISTASDLRVLSADSATLEWGLLLAGWQEEVLPGIIQVDRKLGLSLQVSALTGGGRILYQILQPVAPEY